jgi:hypothetical protein
MRRSKRTSVKRGKTILENGLTMKTGRITFIPTPIVRRIKRRKKFHIIITVGLGKYRSGSNGKVKCITVWDSSMRDTGIRREMRPVHEDMLWGKRQEVYSTMHSQNGCIEDIESVYLLRRSDGHSPRNSFLFDKGTEGITLFFCELLAVVKRGVRKIRRKDDGSGEHIPRQTTSSGLVTTGFDTVRI